MLTKEIDGKIQEWLSDSYDKETNKEIQFLLDNKNEKELVDRFYKELDFGTGGLRGVIGAGTNRMNIYTVGKMAQGISNYLLKNDPASIEKGIVIAYDSRNMSYDFSLRAALIFAGNGIKAFLFENLHATPILSFSIRHLGAISGMMVTASHNPPEYNGIKVYYSDGAQVLPPHDKGMINEVRNIKSVNEIKVMSEEEAKNKNLFHIIGKEIDEAYYRKVLSLSIHPEIIKDTKNDPKIIFTPLHGTGNIPVREVLKRAGFNHVTVVPEQEMPDGNFPTVEYPNPEEAKALKLAIELAKKNNSDLVLANDPDADRVGIAVNSGNNDFVLLNGNQVGVILAYYICSQYKEMNKLPDNALIIKTIVSTDLINGICDDYNVELQEVLTGFKYIAEKVKIYHDIENKSKEFLFGFEESYGYNAGDFVRDKDAVTACLLIAELTAFCKKNDQTLLDYLDDIYRKYGYFLESLESLTLKGKEGVEQIQNILKHFREQPPKIIAGSSVVKIRDVKRGNIIDLVSNKELELDLPESNVLTYYLENGGKVTLRPSGTEPKVKFYFSFNQQDTNKSLDEIKSLVKENLHALTEDFMSTVKGLIK